jgi:hypothetical protein
MISQGLIRIADVFFTILLVLMAVMGVLLVWVTGDIGKLTAAMLLVTLAAPFAYRLSRRPAA